MSLHRTANGLLLCSAVAMSGCLDEPEPVNIESAILEEKGPSGPPTCQSSKPYCQPGADEDHDGVPWENDNCGFIPNPDQLNSDGDPYGNACDNCPNTAGPLFDCDDDGVGDICDGQNARWQTTTTPICWVDRDRHFGFYTLEFKALETTTDLSSCGNPTQTRYVTVREDDCSSESDRQCCLNEMPASAPFRDSLCSHVDRNFCFNWPPPAPTPEPPQTCPNGATLQTYLFCLRNPEPLGNPPPDCNQFEVVATACSHAQARTLAQGHAINWTISDGGCPPCP